MSTASHQYFRKVPDIDKELEYLLQFVLKEGAGNSEPETNLNTIHTVTYVNRSVTPVIQSGPMCGLVALTMASDVLKSTSRSSTINDDVHPEELLRLSKERRLSNNGEIFAVEYLKQIAQEQLQDCRSEVVSLELVDVVDTVLSGKSLLVPYDADKDHTPCLERGRNAHWCLVVGITVTVPVKDDHLYSPIFECCSPMPSLPGHFIIREEKVTSLQAHRQLITSSPMQVYVFARHGKSSHLGLWKFSDLLESNKNLLEVDRKRTRPGEYIIPCGGIKEGLCGKALVISKKLS